jgi:glycosyltransferase involved in cell wall biosynthesis
MRLGIAIEDTWGFFNEVYDYLAAQHETSVFHRREWALPFFQTRLNRRLFENDLDGFLRANDVVFFEWASGLLAEASHRPKRGGIVTRLHRYELYQWADKINWDAVDCIILVSEAKRREFARRFPQVAAKAIVIPEAVSLKRFSARPKAFGGDLGTLCHLAPRKRVYELVLAFGELCRERNDLHLHIGGEPRPNAADYSEALTSLVRKLGLTQKVTFYGKVTNPQDWYRRLDIFVSNSYSEGLQVSPIEAIASGCYALSHRWDGADELLPEENLYYTDRELQEKVLAHCNLSELARLKANSDLRSRVCEQFDVEKTRKDILHAIEEVGASVLRTRSGR